MLITLDDWVCVAGSVYGGYNNPKLTYDGHVKMWQGSNKISILSSAVGLPVSFPQLSLFMPLDLKLFVTLVYGVAAHVE